MRDDAWSGGVVQRYLAVRRKGPLEMLLTLQALDLADLLLGLLIFVFRNYMDFPLGIIMLALLAVNRVILGNTVWDPTCEDFGRMLEAHQTCFRFDIDYPIDAT